MNIGCNRRTFVRQLTLLATGLPSATFAQDVTRRQYRFGLLAGNEPSLIAAFRDELRKLGYVEGENLTIQSRLYERSTSDIASGAAELAHLDLVVAASLLSALELRKANPAVRMVIATCPGMISNGFAASLERPGGRVTGMDELPPGITKKRLSLLKSTVPAIGRVALLSTTPGRGGHETQLAEAEQAAADLHVVVKPFRASSLPELETALRAIADQRMDGLLSFQGGLAVLNRQVIVDFAAQHRLPAIYQATLFAEAGGLMAWAPDLEEQFRAAARYVDQILKGAEPGDLPIRHPARYYLTLNASAAKALTLSIPQDVLAQADRVLP
jgi:putative tryptophan/tyrosine transport system substrate-binding protein